MRASLSIPIGVFGLGLLIAGTAPAFAQQSVTYPTVDVQQIPGNISSIGQTGSANAASVEQQAILGAAYANSAQIQQNGCASAFFAAYPEANEETVIDFLAFSSANPSSIKSCLETARTNARAVRTALTADMWEAINAGWLELKRFDGTKMDRPTLNEFLSRVKEACLRFDGSAYRTMLRNDVYFFSRVGVYLERADNTARILDVKYHVLLPEPTNVGGGLDYFQWSSILRSVSALTAYRWVYREKPEALADRRSPRPQRADAAFAGELLRKPATYLDHLSLAYGRQGTAQRTARSIRTKLQNAPSPTFSRTACTNSSTTSSPTMGGSARQSRSNT